MSLKRKNIEFELIWKKANNKLSQKEEGKFNSWLEAGQKHKVYFEKVKTFCQTGKVHNSKALEVALAWNETEPRLVRRKTRVIPDWIKIVSSVAATAIIMLSIYILVETKPEGQGQIVKTEIQLPPGQSKARLIFDDGQSIELEEGKDFKTEVEGTVIANQGSQISYSGSKPKGIEKPTYNTLEIPRGAEYFLLLSDSTKVWLNSDSRLRYPIRFVGDERYVELFGEAYFEVAKHKDKPFKVKTGGQFIEVLGTEFNISSYEQEELIYTTLVEGRVKVYSENTPELSQSLVPGYQTYYYKETGDISIREVDVRLYTAWKDGVFSFKNETLGKMMETLSRWYNMEVVFENENLERVRFTGDIQRYEELDKLLNLLEKTEEVQFVINGDQLIIK